MTNYTCVPHSVCLIFSTCSLVCSRVRLSSSSFFFFNSLSFLSLSIALSCSCSGRYKTKLLIASESYKCEEYFLSLLPHKAGVNFFTLSNKHLCTFACSNKHALSHNIRPSTLSYSPMLSWKK